MQLKRSSISLTEKEKTLVQAYINNKVHSTRSIKRAQILLQIDKQTPINRIATNLGITTNTVYNILFRYEDIGLACIPDAIRSNNGPLPVDPELAKDILAFVNSPVPKGHRTWSTTLLSKKLKEKGYTRGVSQTNLIRILKKLNIQNGDS